jgi:hypothetical protein
MGILLPQSPYFLGFGGDRLLFCNSWKNDLGLLSATFSTPRILAGSSCAPMAEESDVLLHLRTSP